MGSTERQKKILDLLYTKKDLKISELSLLLHVSEMTIHRDLKPIIQQGVAIKTFGGVTLAKVDEAPQGIGNRCVICGKPNQNRLSYRIILLNNRVESACCVHCGFIRQNQINDQVVQAICYDFLFDTTISVSTAWFVMDTTIHLGCCQPQLLPFGKKEHAERFVKGFGGSVYSFQEAIHRIHTPAQTTHDHFSCCKGMNKTTTE